MRYRKMEYQFCRAGNAGLENGGPTVQGWKMQDQEIWDQLARLEMRELAYLVWFNGGARPRHAETTEAKFCPRNNLIFCGSSRLASQKIYEPSHKSWSE